MAAIECRPLSPSNSNYDDVLDSLIARIQLEDIQELVANRKGKSSTASDAEVAQDLYLRELEAWQSQVAGHQCALKLDHALKLDVELVQDIERQEQIALEDHDAAREFQRTGVLPQTRAKGAETEASLCQLQSVHQILMYVGFS